MFLRLRVFKRLPVQKNYIKGKTISDWGQDCHSSTNWIKNMDIEKTARQEYLILQELDSYRKP
jgi:hypothetical protein